VKQTYREILSQYEAAKRYYQRAAIAWEIIRRVDTVTLLRCYEVEDIHRRAQNGDFDDFGLFDPYIEPQHVRPAADAA
jgi:hypothetical protein